MKFQIEFLEITEGFPSFDQELALELADKVCSGEMTRKEARVKLEEDSSHKHYHGGPMWGREDLGNGKIVTCKEVLYKNSCALVSYHRMDQLKFVLDNARLVVFDNGAFSDWMKNDCVNRDSVWWAGYYAKVLSIYSRIKWFLIPDVIEGSEEENDKLIESVPSSLRDKGVPVWHSVESLERLGRLCREYDIVAIGLCGIHKKTMSKVAQARLEEVFRYIYLEQRIDVKIHGLRMLDGRVLGKFPFYSADSSFVAINVPKTKQQMKEVQCKLARTAIYKSKIESVIPPTLESWIYEKMESHLLL